ncbi:hypothetical protein L1987_87933 [Smallanthus sonchifolius]|nr:hypothetical protein L1987_87933 [Smallanthus sonchifolius]
MLLKHFTVLIVILSRTKASSHSHVAQSLPGCPDKCGNITIPYPFGIGKDCSLSEAYQVNCTTLQVSNATFKLLGIALDDGLMRGLLPMAYRCYNSTGSFSNSDPKIRLSRFLISSKLNLLTTVGCEARTELKDLSDIDYITKHNYRFQKSDLDNLQNQSFPVALEWTVGDSRCKHAKKNESSYMCKENSICKDSHGRTDQGLVGYNCRCAPGYKGNPYLPNGCQDMNECEGSLNDCIHGCVNKNGSYTCLCSSRTRGDGRRNGTAIGTGPATSFALTVILYWGLRQRRTIKSREMFFKKNGGLILQKILFESKQSSHMAKIFAARILEKATNNFHKTNVIGQGGYGTVYKAIMVGTTWYFPRSIIAYSYFDHS